MTASPHLPIGPLAQPDGSTLFRVWAPSVREISLHIIDGSAGGVILPMQQDGDDYYQATVPNIGPGTRYFYRLNHQTDRPDPASRFQPQGVHGPSQVTERAFPWTDAAWRGLRWQDYVIYELHVGTFTPTGTFDAMIERLDTLVRLGITAIELMPVAQFPGDRNWGYDGVHPFAPQNTYGGPVGLKALVDACHARGLAVILDVVYNHLGPEGNYLHEFGPYFTDRYRTPWGAAVNFDGAQSDAVRDYFIANAVYWIEEFHIDGLRLDATHAIFDQSAQPFLRQLTGAVHNRGRLLGRSVVVLAENNANDPRFVRDARHGGLGMDGQLLDDFQRSLHALVSGERARQYGDFGTVADFAKAVTAGFVLTGQHSAYRRRCWGDDADDVPADRFVAYAQSHDAVGNRPGGRRPGSLLSFDELKLTAAATILSPSIPFLFMGEEYDEPSPFHYFISHLDPALIESVRAGRAREFAAFACQEHFCDPQELETFEQSRLTLFSTSAGHHGVLWRYYQELLRLRKELPAIRQPAREHGRITYSDSQALVLTRNADADQICLCFNFGSDQAEIVLPPSGGGAWSERFSSLDERWSAAGQTKSAAKHTPPAITLEPKSCLLFTAAN